MEAEQKQDKNLIPVDMLSVAEFSLILYKAVVHLKNIQDIVKTFTDKPEGGIYFHHASLESNPALQPKQINICSLASKAKNILEIGFNTGTSSLFMLLCNPTCKIYCFDICEHPYVKACFEYLNDNFDNRLVLIEGDSNKCLQAFLDLTNIKFDLFHIDGAHNEKTFIDFFLCRKIYLKNPSKISYVIFDDTWIDSLQKFWDAVVRDGYVKEAKVLETPVTGHRCGVFV